MRSPTVGTAAEPIHAATSSLALRRPAVLYGQWGVLDTGVAAGIALSSALEITSP